MRAGPRGSDRAPVHLPADGGAAGDPLTVDRSEAGRVIGTGPARAGPVPMTWVPTG
ncbi:hypothetical protein ACFWA6_11715 [Streptomyces sp. NPDC060020]|uniref:hypothetical protein n=1 Tax=Streptomyces sp. NPDC060020 TaxID=3347038 RepID=UPI003677BDB6